MKVALVNPQTETRSMRELYDHHENHALALLHAQLEQHLHQCETIDLRVDSLSERDAAQQIMAGHFDLVVFSVNYATMSSALLISGIICLEAAHKPVIALGGEHASYQNIEIMETYPHIDVICHGEGEATLLQLANALEEEIPLESVLGITYRRADKVVEAEPQPPISELDILPFADHHVAQRAISKGKCVEIGIMTKRGCPYPCSFCNAQRFLGNGNTGVRDRSPESVVEEIEQLAPLVKQTGQFLRIYDATLVTPSNTDRKWFNQFCDLMEAKQLRVPMDAFIRTDSFNLSKEKDRAFLERLRGVGLISTYLGLEAGDDQQLELYNKKTNAETSEGKYHYLRSLGMSGSSNGIINFFQGSTIDQLKTNAAFLSRVGMATFWNFLSRAETLPGIEMNKSTKQQPRKNLWDVSNYQFEDRRVHHLYEALYSIGNQHYFVRYEDRIARRIRDNIRIKNFYQGYLGYSEQEQAFDDHIQTLQSFTVEFVLAQIENVSLENAFVPNPRDIRNYVAKMNEGLAFIADHYREYI
ncbi:B12-binding domain-containing radical SAM protein [Aliagarivorans taiwanensis]|uniref:B12-binding domain-containing radical SAM protein n=1 Tax=Aliagarivorans taiwanensis TaxID=561966 RepID=UPI00047DB9EA|nr:B12-binding domain-containing radical SAM protein [Aliagarivorans taiwanensis]